MFKLREESRLEAEMLTDELKEQLVNDYKQLEEDIELWKKEEQQAEENKRQMEENAKNADRSSACWILLFTYSILSVIYIAFLKPDPPVVAAIDLLLIVLSSFGLACMVIILFSLIIAVTRVVSEETWKIKDQQGPEVD